MKARKKIFKMRVHYTRYTILFFLCMVPAFVNAQLRVTVSAGYGMYNMNDLVELQEYRAKTFPVKGETTSLYPAYFNFEGSLVYESKRPFFAGAIIGYGSSGARTCYSDYSGSMSLDQVAWYYSMSASLGFYQKLKKEKLTLYFDLRPGFINTYLDLISKQKIGNQAEVRDKSQFTSSNIAVQPTLSVLKRVGKFGLNVHIGMNINVFCDKLEAEDHDVTYLEDHFGNATTADWTGLRVGAGVSYYLR